MLYFTDSYRHQWNKNFTPQNRRKVHNILRTVMTKVMFEKDYYVLCIIISTPSIRKDLFRRNVWNGLILQKRLEMNYFANAHGRDLFRDSVWKGLIPNPISEDLFMRLINAFPKQVPSEQPIKEVLLQWQILSITFAFSKRKLCNGENFRIKDFDEFRCFWGS